MKLGIVLLNHSTFDYLATADLQSGSCAAQGGNVPVDLTCDPVLGWDSRMDPFSAIRTARPKKLGAIELEMKKLEDDANDPKGALRTGGQRSAEERGKAWGDALAPWLIPGFIKVQTAWDRSTQTFNNVQVAFTLAQYERDHKRYPKELPDLVPKYLRQVPEDYFSGKPLIYRPNGVGIHPFASLPAPQSSQLPSLLRIART
jgi:hypothetical protein